jgi:hypothetical protein
MTIDVTLPYQGWWPRPHQEALWSYLQHGGKRALAVWHRRAGKDDVCLHHTNIAAWRRVGNYWHCLPEFEQARKAIWTAVNAHTGRRRIDEAFPEELRHSVNDHAMFIRFKNGSTWQCIGSDRYDATVGAGVAGIVYSEWALANPSAWAYHRPMVEENDGWAAFISTPRGRNHLFGMAQHARTDPSWFYQLLTVDDTGSLNQEALASALREYTALYGADAGRAQFRQEYYCDWQAGIIGAYYSLEMADVRAEGRIANVEALPDQLVHRAWDLGVSNDTAVIWFQLQGAQLVILDCYAASGVGVEHYAEVIEKRNKQHGWLLGNDYVPHDARVKEWGTGRTRVETMTTLGLHPTLVPMATIEDGINAVRRTLPLCVFHTRTEDTLIAALEQHKREWDDDKKVFRASALKDWTSDKADAFRYLAQAWRYAPLKAIPEPAIRGIIIPPPVDPRRGLHL